MIIFVLRERWSRIHRCHQRDLEKDMVLYEENPLFYDEWEAQQSCDEEAENMPEEGRQSGQTEAEIPQWDQAHPTVLFGPLLALRELVRPPH